MYRHPLPSLGCNCILWDDADLSQPKRQSSNIHNRGFRMYLLRLLTAAITLSLLSMPAFADASLTNEKQKLSYAMGIFFSQSVAQQNIDLDVPAFLQAIDDVLNKSEPKLSKEEICGMGIGFPGPLNAETGTIFNPPNLQGWDSVPLRDILEKELKISVAIENDANAAALGEWWKGAGSGADSLFCITLGTGVGGGIILDGKVWHGASSIAGEIGHTTVIRDGIKCTCGNIGCLEAYACSGGILKRVNVALLNERDNGLQPLTNLKQVDQMATQGNEIVLNVIKETGVILGIAIANIANLLNPEMIILFGGVTNLGEHLVVPLKEEVKGRAFKKATDSLRIELSQLGDNSGILGAARNILSKL